MDYFPGLTLYSFTARPDSVFIHKIETFVSRARQSGISQMQERWLYARTTKSFMTQIQSDHVPIVTMDDFLQLFQIYFFNKVLIFIIFLTEVLYFNFALRIQNLWRLLRNR